MPGMQEKPIPVPERLAIPSGQVTALVDRQFGNGRVINWPINEHLAGSVVWNRAETTTLGKKRKLNILSLDSAQLQIGQIFDNSMQEAARIGGSAVDPQAEEPGEIEKVREARRQLLNWPELTGEDKFDISLVFGGIQAERVRARNLFSVPAGERAGRMKDLKDRTGRDNPGAILAMTHPEEADLAKRLQQIVREVLAANDSRDIKVFDWMLDEDRYTESAYQTLDELAKDPGNEDLWDRLRSNVSLIRFRVQAFNQLEYARQKASGHIEDEEVIRTTQKGIDFDREHGSLLAAFRQLSDKRVGDLKDNFSGYVEEFLPKIEAVVEKLGGMAIGGPYDVLIDRLTDKAEKTAEALTTRGAASLTHQLSIEFKWLGTYYCMPRDAEAQKWYGQFIYSQIKH